MSSLLIKNGTIVTMNSRREVVKGDLLVEGNRISRIGRNLRAAAHTVIDATGRLASRTGLSG